ncbi:unnamed protein product [Thelazia callipaeda]|uniref:PDZ domain-containing protein n=1 Tax=Thelazia callipaeda TaxID=103827 RepID=A0A0N5D565_THECL|nr:unnamed protein product [Thelazia callipaeda]
MVLQLQFEVYRTVKNEIIKDPRNSPFIPAAVEIQEGYEYLHGYLTLYPGSSLGINIKAFNYKVYVVSTDNGFTSLGVRTFMIGDAILAVDGQAQTTCSAVSQAIMGALNQKRYVTTVIERPKTMVAAYIVQGVISAERTNLIDPKMPEDVIAICNEEVERVKKSSPKHLKKEVFIGMNPINPALLKKVHRQHSNQQALEQRHESQIRQFQQQQTTDSRWEFRRTSSALRAGIQSIRSTLKSIGNRQHQEEDK